MLIIKVRKLCHARYKCNNKRDPKIINLNKMAIPKLAYLLGPGKFHVVVLVNLKKAEHRNNELFAYCFRYCLAYSHLSKVNLPLIPEKMEGKQKLVRKICDLSV